MNNQHVRNNSLKGPLMAEIPRLNVDMSIRWWGLVGTDVSRPDSRCKLLHEIYIIAQNSWKSVKGSVLKVNLSKSVYSDRWPASPLDPLSRL